MIFCACSNMLVSSVLLQPSELAKALATRAAKITESKLAPMDLIPCLTASMREQRKGMRGLKLEWLGNL